MKQFLPIMLIFALAGCGDRKSTEDWIGQLHASDGALRLHAVDALGGRRGEAEVVVPALVQTLGDKDAFIRRAAAQALAKLGAGARPALPTLQQLARDRHRHVREAAADAVRKIEGESRAAPNGE